MMAPWTPTPETDDHVESEPEDFHPDRAELPGAAAEWSALWNSLA